MRKDDTTLRQAQPARRRGASLGVTVLFSPDREAVGQSQALGRLPLQLGRTVAPPGVGFEDAMASRHHAEIAWDDGRQAFLVRDLDSSNGTRVNGRPVASERLDRGDVLRLGDTVLWLDDVDPAHGGWATPPGCALVGASPSLRRLLDDIDKIAASDVSVLVVGATGTGKELAAQELHRRSGRRGAFVAVNCAAIPADLLESELFGHERGAFSGADRARVGLVREADGGTLFLDEVGELRPDHQAKLLRVLQERNVRPIGAPRAVDVEVRVVAASQSDLHGAPGFRQDLLARLDGWTLELEPLRARLVDVLPIAELVLARHGEGRPWTLSGACFEALALHDWPMNARELVAAVRRAMLAHPGGGVLDVQHLPRRLRRDASTGARPALEPPPLPPEGEEPTARELALLLEHFAGNVAEVARHTGRQRMQVYRWLRRHALDPDGFRRDPS